MSRRLILGLGAIGAGAGYYLYRAGGDPELAKKGAEKDFNKAASEIKSNLPGNTDQARKAAEEKSQAAAGGINRALDQAKSATNSAASNLSASASDAQKKLDEARKSTGDALNKGVDKFDRSVEEGASKAKSGISSWFGGK